MHKSDAEKYKQEMMKLYGRRVQENREEREAPAENSDEDINENEPELNDEDIFNVDEESPDDTAYAPFPEENREETEDIEDEFNNRYPEPDLSELENMERPQTENTLPPEYANEESLGSSVGYIQVNVRTGDESTPIEGATVMVTAIVGGSRLIIASGRTDQSGTTEKIGVPAQDISGSQSPGAEERPYNLYDVSVTAENYFNARSVDVPVFAGITSIQNFSMIPVPALMSSNAETMTYFNQEPDFKTGRANERG